MFRYIILITIFISLPLFAKLPTLKANNEELKITQMSVDIEIIGGIANTTFDITYYNPFNKNLIGEFSMPLNEGQKINHYALMVNGSLRDGVVVEKRKARKAFEAVVRKKVDPAIASISKGNFFNTKIYPIPAKGYKRVVIGFTELINGNKYILPIQNQKPIDKFTLDINILKSDTKDNQPILKEFNKINISQNGNSYSMHFTKNNFSLNRPIEFNLPKLKSDNYQLFTQTIKDKTYFYIRVKQKKRDYKNKKTPKSIAIYWDNSLSANNRDINKELSLLSTYLKSIKGKKRVTLIPFNYRQNRAIKFIINNNTSKLEDKIKSLENGGGTTINRLKFSNKYSETIIFSDGINTIGGYNLKVSKKPIYTVTSSSGSNYYLLKNLAKKSGGEFINLNNLTQNEALTIMLRANTKKTIISYNKKYISDIYTNYSNNREYLTITGIVKKEGAKIFISSLNRKIDIKIKENNNISYIWASNKIDYLSMDYKNNKKQILNLSKQFSIVTKDSSFIVLDSVRDYAKYHIIPPKELRDEYYKIVSREDKNRVQEIDIVKNNIYRINTLKEWYKNYRQESKQDGLGGDITPIVMESIQTAPTHIAKKRKNNLRDKEAKIKILAWSPNSSYMVKLRKIPIKDFDQYYYKFREENLHKPSFYIEVSNYLFKKHKHKKAVRVLSNILEFDLGNIELLKIVAKEFLAHKEYKMAIMIYKEIAYLRPDEPQSFRDLALAYTQSKKYQKALNTYNFILSKDWGRFEDIKDVIFNELNHLISKHKRRLNIRRVNKRYIYKMPLDVRIVTSWSSNENDIDLWIIDPNGEKCYYGNRYIKNGGKLSRDFTRGYGPEEYTIKKAPKGIYTVYLNYFSDSRQSIAGGVTIHATLTTNYGKSNERSKDIMIQLIDNKQTMQIGELEFK